VPTKQVNFELDDDKFDNDVPKNKKINHLKHMKHTNIHEPESPQNRPDSLVSGE